jgi:hypothetical protein
MTKTLMVLAAGTALATATPAMAQSNYGYANVNTRADVSVRIAQLRTDINAGIRNSTITRTEALPLRQQLRQLEQLERQYAANGLTVAERQDLNARISNMRQQVRFAARNDLTRYGANTWIDNNRDGFDDRDVNRDGIIDRAYGANGNYQNGYYGQGGPYEPVAQCTTPQRGGIAGILGSVLGTGSSSYCGLQVGQRVNTGLYAVPYQYQGQYRDGNGVYYRSDGRAIYQIDARTNVVTRVYGM